MSLRAVAGTGLGVHDPRGDNRAAPPLVPQAAKKPIYHDFVATDDWVHGQQLGRHFNGYYDHDIFLPLFVCCGDQLLGSYLHPASLDSAHQAGAILALLVRRLRQAWPK